MSKLRFPERKVRPHAVIHFLLEKTPTDVELDVLWGQPLCDCDPRRGKKCRMVFAISKPEEGYHSVTIFVNDRDYSGLSADALTAARTAGVKLLPDTRVEIVKGDKVESTTWMI